MRETFEQWMKRVDEVLLTRYGLVSSDLPGWSYRDAYADRMYHATAARQALWQCRTYKETK